MSLRNQLSTGKWNGVVKTMNNKIYTISISKLQSLEKQLAT